MTMPDAPNLPDYIDMAVRGGFPEAITMTERQRGFWFPGYVDQLVHRDVTALAEVRSPERLAALLQATAVSSAGTPALATIATAAGIDASTARVYLDLLEGAQGRVVGIEIKAKASPEPRDARHLEWLQDELVDTFVKGIVLHSGAASYPLGKNIWALPIATVWR
ncbi:hypothetical protein [Myceligenerans indicum]|uniref:DUF4143 domain-containing protein n=1 Tax=Myceligenerans indicum TaxID=2593663 RepID=A0ABS1LMX7_9MICO|nr:hypothetical protein [Myceligenerans indicum]MBL0887434.1 hypothetical protein [Myceligenerans indicum]